MDTQDVLQQQSRIAIMMHQMEAMGRQLQQQNRQIEERSNRFSAVEARAANAENQLLAASQITTPTPSAKRPKLPDPNRFSGDRIQYPAFEEQLVGKIRVDGAFLGSEDVKVHYAFGLLEKDALEFMRPWMQANRDRAAFTVENFLKHLQDGYRDPELTEQARQRLSSIQQGNRSVLEYIAEFDKTFLEAQSEGLPDWQKISNVHHGLNKKTGRLLVGTAAPKEYASWCAHIKSLEREDAAEAARVNSNRPAPPVQPAQPGVQRQLSQVPPGPQFPQAELRPTPEIEMTMGATVQQRRAAWVSQEERNRRFTAGLCRRCGGSGHIIKNCPYLPARRPTPAVQQVNHGPVLEPIPAAEGNPEPEK